MTQFTTIAAPTRTFLGLDQVPTARSHSEAPERSFRVVFPKCRQIAIALLVGVVVFQLRNLDLHAQARPPQQGQTGSQKEVVALQTATPPDVVTVPDGTPLTLKLEKDFSSETAKVGDTVEFTTPYPTRINGLVIVPKGTVVTGTVLRVSHASRAARSGAVKITIEKLNLPSGETATLRQVLKSHTAREMGTVALVSPLLIFAPLAAPQLALVMLSKGNETVYRAGTRTTVYFNGPLSLNREALANLEPPPYKGPPQVFFIKDRYYDYNVELFSDQDFVGILSQPVRLELKPGTYLFSSGKTKEHAVQLEVHEDQQYLLVEERGGLFAKDSQQHKDKIEQLEDAPGVTDRDFTLETPAYKGPAQVNFVGDGKLFCGQDKIFYVLRRLPLRIELNPGTYSFSTRKAKGQTVQIKVQDDHQYWIEIQREGLFIKDFQHLHDDFEHPSSVSDLDFTSTTNFCVPETRP